MPEHNLNATGHLKMLRKQIQIQDKVCMQEESLDARQNTFQRVFIPDDIDARRQFICHRSLKDA